MSLITLAERIYLYVPGQLTALALALALASLIVRGMGLRRGILMSRPPALYGLIGTTGALTAFYIVLAATGQPDSIAARGGVIRLLLINHSMAIIQWNWAYIHLMAKRWKVDNGAI